ncbi:unnamed protein product [Rotaria sp. Silwood1]|nr:unnamed protein product [Rotaria sp. Silwood1]CAF3405250.1 unnamed protein product [Rotaria sp. Silwood1]CAF4824595.1 unnamed protein product [Rotaria sp. Silwood1]CAF4836112.1 unnamed protein product [Rotaria sp. Silwood1]CAF4887790.1 unnamed protein product [Rotaria sp. Silwood1]
MIRCPGKRIPYAFCFILTVIIFYVMIHYFGQEKHISGIESRSSSILEIQGKTDVVHLAVVLSLAEQGSHISEFHLLYESWRFVQNFWPLSRQVVIDLIVFCEQPSCHQLPLSCLPLSYKKKLDLIATCFYEVLDPKIVEEWNDYLYMTSIAFILTKEYRKAIVDYHWILRVDQDAVLSPGLLMGLIGKHRKKLLPMQFGGIEHGIEFTSERTRKIAKKLGYNHSGIHNLCSAWLVNPHDSVKIANLTTIIGRHFLKNEFGRNVPGIENLPDIGEWPKWWRGVTSLYAAEIAINHIYSSTLSHEHESSAIDHPSYSTDSIWNAWHIHCLHNEEYFSKFGHQDELKEFLQRQRENRIQKMVNTTWTDMVLVEVLNEYEKIQMNNKIPIGNITVRDYVRALAWRKAYSAAGAINLN